jgi:hypothetical protein
VGHAFYPTFLNTYDPRFARHQADLAQAVAQSLLGGESGAQLPLYDGRHRPDSQKSAGAEGGMSVNADEVATLALQLDEKMATAMVQEQDSARQLQQQYDKETLQHHGQPQVLPQQLEKPLTMDEAEAYEHVSAYVNVSTYVEDISTDKDEVGHLENLVNIGHLENLVNERGTSPPVFFTMVTITDSSWSWRYQ